VRGGEFTIRPAGDGDRRSLALLLAEVAKERDGIAAEPPVDVDGLASRWHLDGTFVAVADDVVVGEIRVDPSWMGFGDIGMMVTAKWRGRGVGTALIAAGVTWARARGLHKLALGVFPHNRAAIALYRKCGFVAEGRLVRHVRRADGQLWDLLEMGLPLDGSASLPGESASTCASLLPWPTPPPAYGPVVLREFADRDLPMALELATDSYVPLIGSLPANAGEREALDWIARQGGRLAEGTGFSFAIAEADTDHAVGTIGLWLRSLAYGRASAGYSVAPSARGRGIAAAALIALTSFAWTIGNLHRVELYIEPWNAGSVRTAERAGYQREGLLRSHQEIGGQRRDMLLYACCRPLGPQARARKVHGPGELAGTSCQPSLA